MKTNKFLYSLSAMLLLMSSAAVAGGPAFSVQSGVSGDPGEQVMVDFDWQTGGGTYDGLSPNINYDTAVLSVVSCTINSALWAGWTDLGSCPGFNPGVVTAGMTWLAPANPGTPDGVVFTVLFEINGAATPGSTTDLTIGEVLFGSVDPVTKNSSFISINLPPQPDWVSNPATNVILDFGNPFAGSPELPVNVTNGGEATSTLQTTDGNCEITGTDAAAFAIVGDNTLGAGLGQGESQDITVSCMTATGIGLYDDAKLSCPHNGDGTTEASPAEYALVCNVTAGPQPAWGSTPVGPGGDLPAIATTEQNDPNPAPVVLAVTNSSTDGGTLLSTTGGGCTAPAPFIVTNPTFSNLAEGGNHNVSVTCDATASPQLYTDTMSCAHDGSNGPTASYGVSCEITPPGQAVYQSTPAPGPVDLGEAVQDDPDPDQLLTISNGADPGDQNLDLIGCTWNGAHDGIDGADIGPASLAPGGSETATTTFSCDTETLGDKTGNYRCEYNLEGGLDNETMGGGNLFANYFVECNVRGPESRITPDVPNGNALPRINVQPSGTGTTSVTLTEDFGDMLDATVVSCELLDGINFEITAPTFPYDLAGGDSVDVVVQGNAPAAPGLYEDVLSCEIDDTTCDAPDAGADSCQLSWPVSMNVATPAPVSVPSSSQWSNLLLIVTLFGMSAFFLRRRKLND